MNLPGDSIATSCAFSWRSRSLKQRSLTVLAFFPHRKTCPRRGPGGAEAAVIQPALDAADMFGVGSLGTPVGRTTGPVPAVGRIQPLKLEAAIDAANRRVLNAESAVAGAQTNEDFEEATSALDLAVSQLERIGACAKRCALVAYSLSTPSMDISPTPALREGKRLRLDSAAQPIAPRLDEDGQEVQQQDPDALPKLETEE